MKFRVFHASVVLPTTRRRDARLQMRGRKIAASRPTVAIVEWAVRTMVGRHVHVEKWTSPNAERAEASAEQQEREPHLAQAEAMAFDLDGGQRRSQRGLPRAHPQSSAPASCRGCRAGSRAYADPAARAAGYRQNAWQSVCPALLGAASAIAVGAGRGATPAERSAASLPLRRHDPLRRYAQGRTRPRRSHLRSYSGRAVGRPLPSASCDPGYGHARLYAAGNRATPRLRARRVRPSRIRSTKFAKPA
jgi:hypothetical protein